jgi:hypothetical protein
MLNEALAKIKIAGGRIERIKKEYKRAKKEM